MTSSYVASGFSRTASNVFPSFAARTRAAVRLVAAMEEARSHPIGLEVRRQQAPVSEAALQAASRLEAILDREYAQQGTVETFARRVKCNHTDLENAFRSLRDCSIHRYLTLCRVRAACRLLRLTAWRAEEIAKAVGYRSKVSLFDNFNLVMGMTPEQYRLRWWFMSPRAPLRGE